MSFRTVLEGLAVTRRMCLALCSCGLLLVIGVFCSAELLMTAEQAVHDQFHDVAENWCRARRRKDTQAVALGLPMLCTDATGAVHVAFIWNEPPGREQLTNVTLATVGALTNGLPIGVRNRVYVGWDSLEQRGLTKVVPAP